MKKREGAVNLSRFLRWMQNLIFTLDFPSLSLSKQIKEIYIYILALIPQQITSPPHVKWPPLSFQFSSSKKRKKKKKKPSHSFFFPKNNQYVYNWIIQQQKGRGKKEGNLCFSYAIFTFDLQLFKKIFFLHENKTTKMT